MAKCHFSVMCIVCTLVSVISVAMLVGIWTFQFLAHAEAPTALWENYNLPNNLLPGVYYVSSWSWLQLYVLTRNSSKIFRCVKDTDLILIHSTKLNLTTASGRLARLTALSSALAPAIQSSRMQVNTQYLIIQLNSRFMAGESDELFIEFVGELAGDWVGFHRSQYIEDRVKKVVATTQFHPSHAHETFPCFNELAVKTVFHITDLQKRGMAALSNRIEMGQWHIHTKANQNQ